MFQEATGGTYFVGFLILCIAVGFAVAALADFFMLTKVTEGYFVTYPPSIKPLDVDIQWVSSRSTATTAPLELLCPRLRLSSPPTFWATKESGWRHLWLCYSAWKEQHEDFICGKTFQPQKSDSSLKERCGTGSSSWGKTGLPGRSPWPGRIVHFLQKARLWFPLCILDLVR